MVQDKPKVYEQEEVADAIAQKTLTPLNPQIHGNNLGNHVVFKGGLA